MLTVLKHLFLELMTGVVIFKHNFRSGFHCYRPLVENGLCRAYVLKGTILCNEFFFLDTLGKVAFAAYTLPLLEYGCTEQENNHDVDSVTRP